jgi:putative holliday junction resolvase
MPVVDVMDLPATALFGLDIGEKTVGVAVSDPLRNVASPLQLIRRRKFTDDARELLALMAERGSQGLVVGLPLNMDGTEGPRCQSVRAFARNLLRLDPRPAIAFWDERLSTVAVSRMLVGELDMTRARRVDVVDRAAAAYILQGALDRLRHG